MSTQPEGDYVPEWTDGDKLRKVRLHMGMTQADFAEALQVNAVTYSGWESDRNRIKDLKTIARRIKVLSGTPLWWWFDTERPVCNCLSHGTADRKQPAIVAAAGRVFRRRRPRSSRRARRSPAAPFAGLLCRARIVAPTPRRAEGRGYAYI